MITPARMELAWMTAIQCRRASRPTSDPRQSHLGERPGSVQWVQPLVAPQRHEIAAQVLAQRHHLGLEGANRIRSRIAKASPKLSRGGATALTDALTARETGPLLTDSVCSSP